MANELQKVQSELTSEREARGKEKLVAVQRRENKI